MGTEWVAPSIAGVFLLIGSITTVIITTRTNKRTAEDQHAPDVMEAWKEADRARAQSRHWEDMYYLVRNAFKGYARRMFDQFGDSAQINSREHIALETDPQGTGATPEQEPTA
jgi:hypothetical protein